MRAPPHTPGGTTRADSPSPDDLEIGSAGLIAKLSKQGYRVGMVHMTNGEPTPRGSPEVRLAEAHAAAEVLGVSVCEVLGLPNRQLMDSPEARYAVAAVIRKYKPRILVGTAGRTVSASPDHYQAQLIAEAVRFYSQLTKWDDRFAGTQPHRVDHLIYRPIPRAVGSLDFPTQFVVDITDTIDQKLAAVACYKSQFPASAWTISSITFCPRPGSRGAHAATGTGSYTHCPAR